MTKQAFSKSYLELKRDYPMSYARRQLRDGSWSGLVSDPEPKGFTAGPFDVNGRPTIFDGSTPDELRNNIKSVNDQFNIIFGVKA